MLLGCKIFRALNLINNVLNNILFLFVSVAIDVCLIRFANKNYQRKKKKIHDPKHLDEALKHKKKIRKLIITNGVLFFFSHVPEFASTLLLIVFKARLNYFCFTYFSCTEINDVFQVFVFLGISLQFFVYLNFDHNFKQSFGNLKTKYFKWIKIIYLWLCKITAKRFRIVACRVLHFLSFTHDLILKKHSIKYLLKYCNI